MSARNWRAAALRWLSLCGIVAPLFEMLVNVLVGTWHADYSYFQHYISDLTVRGRPYGDVLGLLWAAFPLIFGPFAVAVYAGLGDRPLGRLLAVQIGLFAAFIGLCGIFRYDPFSPRDLLSRGHVVVSALANAAVLPTPFVLWLAMRGDESWRRFGTFSLFIQVAGVVAAILLGLAFFRVIGWGGVTEWGFFGVYYVWIVALALKLRSLSASGA